MLLVLTSTYPRWRDDPEPGFVHHLASHLTDWFQVVVLGPHAPGARAEEWLDGVRVVRFRYAPARFETLVNDGGIVQNLRRHRWKWLLVPGFLVSEFVTSLRLLRELRPAVVHAHWFVPQGLVAAACRRLLRNAPPFVLTSHGADLFALKGTLWRRLRRFVIGDAAEVTVVSSAMREALGRDGIDTTRVRVEPMGVDLEQRFTPDATVERIDDALLFVGRLVPKKGLHVLLDALPAIVAARPAATLTIVGFGPELPALQSQSQRLGVEDIVRFVGAVDQASLPHHYRQASIFVAPFVEAPGGDQEGLGLVVVEAIGCGCRVVVSDLVGTLDFTEVPGVLTRIAPGDAAGLALGVIEMLTAPRGVYSADIARFDWRRRADAYTALLLNAAGLRASEVARPLR
ncbi:MAG: glycosyltransferase [Luteimonas sp.]